MAGRAAGMARRYGRVSEVGGEPDPRFTFANERTFLAWARTGLALMVAGGAIAQFADGVGTVLRGALTIILIGLGSVASVGGYLRWRNAELAMRLGRPLPRSTGPALFATGAAALGAAAVVAIFIDLVT